VEMKEQMTRTERTKLNKELRKEGKKSCPKCDEIKPLGEFNIKGKLKSGDTRYGDCKKCKNSNNHKYYNPEKSKIYAREYYQKMKNDSDFIKRRKKNIKSFYMRKRESDVLEVASKIKEGRNIKFSNQEQRYLKSINQYGCNTCKKIKPFEEMTGKTQYENGNPKYSPICKECYKTSEKREHNLIYLKEWRNENPEYMKDWSKDNDERREYLKNYVRHRYITDPDYRFQLSLRVHLQGVKNRQEFKDKWDDVREVYDFYDVPYHIDHKVPQSWFKVGSPKKIVNHLDNLHVIDAKYNLSKRNFWSDPVPQSFLELARPHLKKKYLTKVLVVQNKFVSLSDIKTETK
jgi:hypothetical protein